MSPSSHHTAYKATGYTMTEASAGSQPLQESQQEQTDSQQTREEHRPHDKGGPLPLFLPDFPWRVVLLQYRQIESSSQSYDYVLLFLRHLSITCSAITSTMITVMHSAT